MEGSAETHPHGPAEGEAELSSLRSRSLASASDVSSMSSAGSSADMEFEDDDEDEMYPRPQCEWEEIPSFRWISSPLRWWGTRKRAHTREQSSDAGAASGGALSGTMAGAEAESGGETKMDFVHFHGHPAFTVEDLMAASTVVLGEGACGTTHLATLDDGNQVAVRRLTRADITREFEAGVDMLGKIRHPSLLPLRAYYHCPEGGDKFLVFDYMPKGSLSTLLHGRLRYITWIAGLNESGTPTTLHATPGPCNPIDWLTRLNIMIGIARGLHYLHAEENIVHGNLTSRRVLLDDHNNARIANYGISNLFSTATNYNLMETTCASGYGAPELPKLMEPNTKTDVYSLGVIMLELLTGKSPGKSIEGMHLPQWVVWFLKRGGIDRVLDRDLTCGAARTMGIELLHTLALALRCVDPSPDARPEMWQVLQKLVEIRPTFAGATVLAAATEWGEKLTDGVDNGSTVGRQQWSPKHRNWSSLSKWAAAAAATAASRDKEQMPADGMEVEYALGERLKLVHFNVPPFTLEDLLRASAELLGKGAHGTSYKATLQDGNEVVVKRLRSGMSSEFEIEIKVLGKIRHPNILSPRAYFVSKDENLLVFDYMPMGSLSSILHGDGSGTHIDWPTRMDIAIGATKGMHYLHTIANIIHGNLTSVNIQLGDRANAKIADFGLSRHTNPSGEGALGYRAPELSKIRNWNANIKTDVYSLGVILLELLTGKSPRQAIDDLGMAQWVASAVKKQSADKVFDPKLMKDVSDTMRNEMLGTLALALICVYPSPNERPQVEQVLRQLEEIKSGLAGVSYFPKTNGGSVLNVEGGGAAGGTTTAPPTAGIFATSSQDIGRNLQANTMEDTITSSTASGEEAMLTSNSATTSFKDEVELAPPTSTSEEQGHQIYSSNDELKERGLGDLFIDLSIAQPEGSNRSSSSCFNMNEVRREEDKAGEWKNTKGTDSVSEGTMNSSLPSIDWAKVAIEAHLEVPSSPPLFSSDPDFGYQRYFLTLHDLARRSPPFPSIVLEAQLNKMIIGLHSLGYPLEIWLKAATLVLVSTKKQEYIEHHVEGYKVNLEAQLKEFASAMDPVKEEVSGTRSDITVLEQKQDELDETITKLEDQLGEIKTQREQVVDSLTVARDQLVGAEAKLESMSFNVDRLNQQRSAIMEYLRSAMLTEIPSLDEVFDSDFRRIMAMKF